MKRLVIMVAMMSSGAFAADMPLKAPPLPIASGTGFYVGVNGGAAGANQATNFVTAPGTSAAVGLPGKLYPSGVPLGGTVGWGSSFGSLYAAVEGDFDWNKTATSATCSWPVAGNIGVNTICGTKNGWVASQRVVIGIPLASLTGAINSTPRNINILPPSQWPIPITAPASISLAAIMPFVTGGVAEKQATGYVSPTTVSGKPPVLFPGGTQSETLVGWTVGGGLKIPLATGWTAKLEIDHFGWNKQFIPASSSASKVSLFNSATFKQIDENRMIAGLDYSF